MIIGFDIFFSLCENATARQNFKSTEIVFNEREGLLQKTLTRGTCFQFASTFVPLKVNCNTDDPSEGLSKALWVGPRNDLA